MSDKTTNIGLIKPSGEDYFDIRHFNDNADIIDEEIAKLKENTGTSGDTYISVVAGGGR